MVAPRVSTAAMVALAAALFWGAYGEAVDWLASMLAPLDLCPPILFPRTVAVLALGANRSAASSVTLLPQWSPVRIWLAEELASASGTGPSGHSTAFDERGRALRCAVDLGRQAEHVVYLAPEGTPWQWSSEVVGHKRSLLVPRVAFDEDEPAGSGEAPWEGAARASMDAWSVAGSERLTLETLSTSPPIFRVRQLLDEQTVRALLREATPHFERSTVGDPTIAADGSASAADGQYRQVDGRRTSRSAWLHGYNDPRKSLSVARAVQRRAASVLALASRRLQRGVEPLLAVEYPTRSFYEPHHDFFAAGGASVTPAEPAFTPPHGSNRFATVIIYLSSAQADDGGHTVFPFAAPVNGSDMIEAGTFAGAPGSPSCDFPQLSQQRGLMLQPTRGDAIIFYDQLVDGRLDGRTRHGSCPVQRGTKHAINVWFWNNDVIYR